MEKAVFSPALACALLAPIVTTSRSEPNVLIKTCPVGRDTFKRVQGLKSKVEDPPKAWSKVREERRWGRGPVRTLSRTGARSGLVCQTGRDTLFHRENPGEVAPLLSETAGRGGKTGTGLI
jgi:hypothetical protein